MSLIFWHTENSVAKLKLFCFSKNIIKRRPKKITGLKFKNISFRERKKMSEEWMEQNKDRRKETVLNTLHSHIDKLRNGDTTENLEKNDTSGKNI